LQGYKAPDLNTIARFRTGRLADIIEDLFNQLIEKLGELGEIEYKNIFIDGTKIEANANKYSFVWRKTTVKLRERVKKLIESINEDFHTNFKILEQGIETKELQCILDFFNKKKEEENIELVNGKGKRKTKVQRIIENIEDFIERQAKYDDYNTTFY
jgi:hypothetical protein